MSNETCVESIHGGLVGAPSWKSQMPVNRTVSPQAAVCLSPGPLQSGRAVLGHLQGRLSREHCSLPGWSQGRGHPWRGAGTGLGTSKTACSTGSDRTSGNTGGSCGPWPTPAGAEAEQGDPAVSPGKAPSCPTLPFSPRQDCPVPWVSQALAVPGPQPGFIGQRPWAYMCSGTPWVLEGVPPMGGHQ